MTIALWIMFMMNFCSQTMTMGDTAGYILGKDVLMKMANTGCLAKVYKALPHASKR